MARARLPEARFDHRGGVNTAYSDELLSAEEIRRAQNGRLTVFGAVAKRGGSKRVHTAALASSAAVLGLYQWDGPGGKEVVAVAGGRLFVLQASQAEFREKEREQLVSRSVDLGTTAGAIQPGYSVRDLSLRARAENMGALYLGDAAAQPLDLSPGESFGMPYAELDHLFARVAVDGDGVEILGTDSLSPTRKPRFLPFRPLAGTRVYLYLADGGLRKWDGYHLTHSIPGAPSVREIEQYKGRIFGTDGTKRLFWSGVGLPEAWDAGSGGGAADVETYDTEGIVGLLTLGSSLLLFKEDSVSRFTGTSAETVRIDTETEGISGDVGLIAPRTLLRVNNGRAFGLSTKGPFLVDEASATLIGEKIRDQFQRLPLAALRQALAVRHDDLHEVWLFVPTPAGDTVGWVWNYDLDAWSGPWLFTGFTPTAACEYERSDDTQGVLLGGADGLVREADTGTADDVRADGTGGAAIALEVEWPALFFSDPARVKHLRQVQHVAADVAGSRFSVRWESEQGSGGVTVPAQGEGVFDYRFRLAARGRRIRLTFAEESTESAQLNGLTLEAALGGRV